MYYLDTANGASMFREARQHTDFVDKSALIDDLYRYARKENKYIAITKPRRFGKTMAANMLSAFFTKGAGCGGTFFRACCRGTEGDMGASEQFSCDPHGFPA